LLLALFNQNNNISPVQRAILPSMCFFGILVLALSTMVTKEAFHQQVWFFAGCLISACVTLNEISWKENYDPDIVFALKGYEASNPVALFYICELGWFLSVVLIFFTVVMRPRFEYLVAVTVVSFISFLYGSITLSPGISPFSLIMRIVIFLICCSFNIKISWNLEQSERMAWFSTATLERKLAIEKNKLRKEAERKSEAERILVAYLCHEIRNPFNGVLGFAELTVNSLTKCLAAPTTQKKLEQQRVSSIPTISVEKVKDWCSSIVVNSKHILGILDNVLDLSQMEAGTLQLARQPIKVSDLCEEIHLLLRPTVREGVSFELQVCPPELAITGDRQRWKQLLVNLLSNAFKFTYKVRALLRFICCCNCYFK
jgi:signal transduction histidine kinase